MMKYWKLELGQFSCVEAILYLNDEQFGQVVYIVMDGSINCIDLWYNSTYNLCAPVVTHNT